MVVNKKRKKIFLYFFLCGTDISLKSNQYSVITLDLKTVICQHAYHLLEKHLMSYCISQT